MKRFTGYLKIFGLIVFNSALASEAFASNLGIDSELISASVAIFCSTSIADDLVPLMELKEGMAKEKMSEEVYKETKLILSEMWKKIKVKHRKNLLKISVSEHIRDTHSSLFQSVSIEAWRQIRRKCAKKSRPPRSASYVREFLSLYISDPIEK